MNNAQYQFFNWLRGQSLLGGCTFHEYLLYQSGRLRYGCGAIQVSGTGYISKLDTIG